MSVDETVETPNGEVEIKLDTAEELIVQLQMPEGIADRCDNSSAEARDIEWMNLVANIATELDDPSVVSNKTVIYVVDCVARSMGDMELQTYNEFVVDESEGNNFIDEGTLGVNND